MTTGEFTATDWIERLAQALAELAKTQERYRDELDRQRQQRIRPKGDLPGWRAFGHPSHDLWAFYSDACAGKDRYYAGEYGPLCLALPEVRHVLAAHPAWTGLVDPSDAEDEIWFQILASGSSGTLLNVTSGRPARCYAVGRRGCTRTALLEVGVHAGRGSQGAEEAEDLFLLFWWQGIKLVTRSLGLTAVHQNGIGQG